MDDIVYLNTSKAILFASQYRCRMEKRLKEILGEERIIGPLDPYISRAVEIGKIDSAEGESLTKIGKFCDSVLLSYDYCKPTSYGRMKSWSDKVAKIE